MNPFAQSEGHDGPRLGLQLVPSGAAVIEKGFGVIEYAIGKPVGQTYSLSGTQLHGLSQGAAYGDDYQSATNYPLVRIINGFSGHVFYANTSSYSTMSIAHNKSSTLNFTVPPSIETGASQLYVVANGIASQPASVMVQ